MSAIMSPKKENSFFRKHILPPLTYFFYRLWSMTWRISIHEPEEMKQTIKQGKTFLIAHWHGDSLILLRLAKRYQIVTMASTSKDGELITYVLKKFGVKVSRGSSTRGGISALKGLVRILKGPYNGGIAVDGPKGPLHQVKPGIFKLSYLTQSPIFVFGAACTRPFVFSKSWDQTCLPRLFSKIVIVWGKGCDPVPKTQNPRSKELSLNLEKALYTAQQDALKLIVGDKGEC